MEESTEKFPCFVVDTSFIAAYLLNGSCDDEFSGCVEEIAHLLENNGQIYVPQLFWFEIGNALLCKTRRRPQKGKKKFTRSDALDCMYDLGQLPIVTDLQPTSEIRQRIFALADEYKLSYYDASYLELARRYSIPLKTYDTELKAAFSRRTKK